MSHEHYHDIEPVTEDEKLSWPPFDRVVKLEKAFTDARGTIQPLVDRLMKSAGRAMVGEIRAAMQDLVSHVAEG